MEEEKKGIAGSTLKIIAIVTMFIDHVGAALVETYLYKILMVHGAEYCKAAICAKAPWLWADWMADEKILWEIDYCMRAIGRIAFPIFCFLLVEGFLHTRSVAKYLIRLLVFAFISDVPFDLAFFGEIGLEHQNVFFTLFFGVAALAQLDYYKKKETFNTFSKILSKIGFLIAAGFGAWAAATSMAIIFGFILNAAVPSIPETVPTMIIGAIAGAVVWLVVSNKWDKDTKVRNTSLLVTVFGYFALAEICNTDYAGWGVLAVVAIYLFRDNKFHGMQWGVLALTIMSVNEGFAFVDLIPVKMYNGKRGLKMKYFFYAFYPAHLLILFLIRYWFFNM